MDSIGILLIIPSWYPLFEKRAELEALIDRADQFHLATLRLASGGLGADELSKRGDLLREIAHARDISVMMEAHPSLALRLGFDGVHLHRPEPKALREARKIMGKDALIGVHAGASKHDGMVLGEIGVDYVSFGPLQDRGLDEEVAAPALFSWWSEMIEVPVVAEAGLSPATLQEIKDHVDFIALGEELFQSDDPLRSLESHLEVL